MLIVNSEKVADNLMDKRSLNYSDRMDMSKMLKPYGLDFDTALIQHDVTWRGHRRVLQQTLRPEVIGVYQSTQLRCAVDLLQNLTCTPASWWKHLRTFSAAVILGATYDHELSKDPENDHILRAVVDGMELALELSSAGPIALISALPILKYLPTWIPGPRWANAANCKRLMDEMINAPFEELLKKMAAGEAGHCVVADALEKFKDTTKVENIERSIRNSCGTAYAAGEETTGSTLIVFTLAMVLYPSVQKRAQAEIDRIVGADRLPDLNDRPSLPYVEAVFRETLRWKPVVPLAIPHAAANEDIYDGYLIPKGTVILPNLWAMSRDSTKYPFPDVFDPERFLDADENITGDTPNFAFGFGRRICPGRHLASGSVWIAMAQILASFSIEKAKDTSGNTVEPNPEWATGATSYPLQFPCNFVPRRL
ncbi:cytochrome P450 [Coniophora puteana RWD-64-598 SS2]|uniref:Cytochrome P450 n=1 Tax=Coniophora puteana (strain RWD-64-598) TaxID=741705 RepID=A0A5M3N0L0_CONPW|nr:cytochrome P450 [Coniophora puteana RWD-64-598 SS2]EIW84445.1 cytochrome P450 [Coniophora puteana RWD-64-598 SS2]